MRGKPLLVLIWTNRCLLATLSVGLVCLWILFSFYSSARITSPFPSDFASGGDRDDYCLPSAGPCMSQQMEGEVPKQLLDFKNKVRVIVTTVSTNRERILLLQQIYDNDPLGKDMFIYLSDKPDPDLHTHVVPQCADKPLGWIAAKCCRFKHFYYNEWKQNYRQVEWMVKMDDDTYIHPKTLLMALLEFNTSEPFVIGDRTSWNGRLGKRNDDPPFQDLPHSTVWPNGGAGWALNQAARDQLLKGRELRCSGLDDVNMGDWVKQNGLPLVPYFGFHQRSIFSTKQEDENGDFLGNLISPAFYLCVKEKQIRLPYYPISFHKLMVTFPYVNRILNEKEFVKISLPSARDENSDNYYKQMRAWVAEASRDYTRVDCHSIFDPHIIKLKETSKLP